MDSYQEHLQAMQHRRPIKGDGKSTDKNASRWVMQSSNGSQWETKGRYTWEEVMQWELAKPVRQILEH